jgi:hypothetical protein
MKIAMFSGVVLVDGHPECSSSTDDHLSLKLSYNKKSFPLAHGIISKGFM